MEHSMTFLKPTNLYYIYTHKSNKNKSSSILFSSSIGIFCWKILFYVPLLYFINILIIYYLKSPPTGAQKISSIRISSSRYDSVFHSGFLWVDFQYPWVSIIWFQNLTQNIAKSTRFRLIYSIWKIKWIIRDSFKKKK